MRRYNAQGYVLLFVLVFLQLFSCLGLYELMSAASLLKENDHWRAHEFMLYHAKLSLRQIEHDILDGYSTCTIASIPAADMARQSINWWKGHACVREADEMVLYYVVEKLGDDECAIIENKTNNQTIIASYYRITLLAAYFAFGYAKVILQSTLAIPAVDHLSCAGNLHTVVVGRQMMREL